MTMLYVTLLTLILQGCQTYFKISEPLVMYFTQYDNDFVTRIIGFCKRNSK